MTRRHLPPHLRQLLREFPQASVRRTRGGHWLIETPAGPIIEASSPSDRRGVANARARLRRAFSSSLSTKAVGKSGDD